jgi:hypothetical protein
VKVNRKRAIASFADFISCPFCRKQISPVVQQCYPKVTVGFAPVAILRKPSRSLLIRIIDVRGMLSPWSTEVKPQFSQVSTLWSARIRSGHEGKICADRFPSIRKIVGRNGGEYFLLDLDEILAFQAKGELVWIATAKQRLLASQILRVVESRLRGQQFERVHRYAIVNVWPQAARDPICPSELKVLAQPNRRAQNPSALHSAKPIR